MRFVLASTLSWLLCSRAAAQQLMTAGVTYSGYVAAQSRAPYYYNVASGVANITVTLTPAASNLDLYVSCSSSVWTTDVGTWNSAVGGVTSERVIISAPSCNTYYIAVRSFGTESSRMKGSQPAFVTHTAQTHLASHVLPRLCFACTRGRCVRVSSSACRRSVGTRLGHRSRYR